MTRALKQLTVLAAPILGCFGWALWLVAALLASGGGWEVTLYFNEYGEGPIEAYVILPLALVLCTYNAYLIWSPMIQTFKRRRRE